MQPGTRVGPYEVLAAIGKGGMGEVWRARDSQLRREVAIKILPANLASDPERLARFQREASLLASLNHPNIATVYGVESGSLVMELVDGPMLSERIKAGSIPPGEALPMIRQIIDAIEYAHDHNVLHRDLKPANIKITEEGVVKVLDFGLAKALDERAAALENPENSPTLTLGHTQNGVIMGTAAYMSPEQAVGKPVDRRSDIFSFGCILFEMLAGRRAFAGETSGETLAAVVKEPPNWTALPAETPAYLRELAERCLAKDRKQRLQAVGEARIALERGGSSNAGIETSPGAVGRGARTSAIAWAVAGVATLAAVGLGWIVWRAPVPGLPLVQSELNLPDGVAGGIPVLSPDGTKIAILGTASSGTGPRQIYLRGLRDRAFTPMPGTEGASNPFWSPDSQWMAYSANGKIMKVRADGGQPQTVGEGSIANTGSWNEDGVILFAGLGQPIQRIAAAGGVPERVLDFDASSGEFAQLVPIFLPDGKRFLYTSNGTTRGARRLASLDGKVLKQVFVNEGGPVTYAQGERGGYLLYNRSAQLWARPFDEAKAEFTGDEVLLADNSPVGNVVYAGHNGVLAYRSGAESLNQLRWYDRNGKGEPFPLKLESMANPRLSFDGKRVLYTVSPGSSREIHVVDSSSGEGAKFVGDALTPALWTPDNHILFARGTKGGATVWEAPVDGIGQERLLHRSTLPSAVPSAISGNGEVVALNEFGGGGLSTPRLLFRRSGKSVTGAISSSTGISALSPDGRWLVNPAGGALQIRAVLPDETTPLPKEAQEITSVLGTVARIVWSRDNTELFVLTRDAMFRIPIDPATGTPRRGALQKLFDVSRGSSFDVTPDGKRFLILETLPARQNPPVILIQNWEKLLPK